MPQPPPTVKQPSEDKVQSKAATTNIESLLVDYAQRAVRRPAGRRAIVIHLSRLRPDNRRSHHVRIAANTFESLVKHLDGQIFLLQSADIVFICKGASATVIDQAVTRLRYLFGDDPLAVEIEDTSADQFATWYDLERDHEQFLSLCEAIRDEAERRKRRLAGLATGAAQRDELQPMDAPALAELVTAIQRADLSNVMRRQSIYAMVANEPPKPVFQEIYISISDLREAIIPERDIASDRWLFQYLTQLLDKRMLAMLRRDSNQDSAHSFSLNLNISTLLSQDFLDFDQALRLRTRGTIVIELQKQDIYADLGAYIFARDFLKERGYRVCLDGISPLTFSLIDREKLGLDLVKLFWSPEMIPPPTDDRLKLFLEALESAGKSRIILAHCDSADAVAFGQALGLRLFQGRHVDRMLNQSSLGSAKAPQRAR